MADSINLMLDEIIDDIKLLIETVVSLCINTKMNSEDELDIAQRLRRKYFGDKRG